MLKIDFAKVLDPHYSVIHMNSPDIDTSSHYFYVFNTRGKFSIDKGKVGSIFSLTVELLGKAKKKKSRRRLEQELEYLDRLKGFEAKGFVTLSFDSVGNLTDVKLNNCVLLIRLSDHDPDPKDSDSLKRLFEARRNIVEQIHYYNIEEVEKTFLVTLNKTEYGFSKSGKKRILYEFREKLESAGIEESLISIILGKVNHMFNNHRKWKGNKSN